MNERSIVCLNTSKFLAAIDSLSQSVGCLWLRPPAVGVRLVLERHGLLGECERTEGIDHDRELVGRGLSDRPFVCTGMRPMWNAIGMHRDRAGADVAARHELAVDVIDHFVRI